MKLAHILSVSALASLGALTGITSGPVAAQTAPPDDVTVTITGSAGPRQYTCTDILIAPQAMSSTPCNEPLQRLFNLIAGLQPHGFQSFVFGDDVDLGVFEAVDYNVAQTAWTGFTACAYYAGTVPYAEYEAKLREVYPEAGADDLKKVWDTALRLLCPFITPTGDIVVRGIPTTVPPAAAPSPTAPSPTASEPSAASTTAPPGPASPTSPPAGPADVDSIIGAAAAGLQQFVADHSNIVFHADSDSAALPTCPAIDDGTFNAVMANAGLGGPFTSDGSGAMYFTPANEGEILDVEGFTCFYTSGGPISDAWIRAYGENSKTWQLTTSVLGTLTPLTAQLPGETLTNSCSETCSVYWVYGGIVVEFYTESSMDGGTAGHIAVVEQLIPVILQTLGGTPPPRRRHRRNRRRRAGNVDRCGHDTVRA